MADTASPQVSTYEPSVGKRLLWWFGLYFGLQLPLIGFIPFFWLFPIGLQYWIHPQKGPNLSNQGLGWYFFYVLHLCITLSLPNKNAFRVMMFLLLVVVALNVVGCMKQVPDLRDLH